MQWTVRFQLGGKRCGILGWHCYADPPFTTWRLIGPHFTWSYWGGPSVPDNCHPEHHVGCSIAWDWTPAIHRRTDKDYDTYVITGE